MVTELMMGLTGVCVAQEGEKNIAVKALKDTFILLCITLT